MDENLNDTEKCKEDEETPQAPKWPLEAKILISCLIILVIILIIVIIIISLSKSKNKDKDNKEHNESEILEKAGYFEKWNDLYGIKMPNLSYIKNDIIINSFKKDGENYNEEIGEINNGKDYPKNERNKYTLYIPYYSTLKKDKYNGILLFIHGGSWTHGVKEDIEFLCTRYSKMGYITATMGYTVLSGDYEQYNIYRILDEITACIKSIKEELEILKFNLDKLEIAIGGISAGAHISLLYGYSIKNPPIKIKFLINIVGPLSLEPEFWYKPAKFNNTLENLEMDTIKYAIENRTIIGIFEEPVFIGLMNEFLGNMYTEEEVKSMLIDNKINNDSEKYQEMFKKVKYSFPIKFINNDTIPTLCEYAGNDTLVGVGMYRFLQNLFEKYDRKLDLVYMRYANHDLISYDTVNGIKAMREMHNKVLEYAKQYFSSVD